MSDRTSSPDSPPHNREQLAAILDSIEAIVYVADMESFKVLFVNRYCKEQLGNITGRICWQTIQTGQNGPCPFCTNHLLLDREGNPAPPHIWEFKNTRNNRWYHITDRAIAWVDGRFVRLEIALDITEKKEAEAKISKAKEEWEQTFDAIDEAVTIHDPKMTVIRANKAAGRLLHADPASLLGRKCHEIFHDSHTPCNNCPELKAHRERSPQSGQIFHPTLDKTFFVSSSPIFDGDAKPSRYVHFAKDITEQIMLQEQLRQAQKMEAIGTLAGGIAHDFNNILAPIIGFTELAIASIGPDHIVASHLAHVLSASKRARELVCQILSFSRQGEGMRKPVQVSLAAREAIKLLRSSLPSSIEIQQAIEENCGVILADPTQIHQILMNLGTNAYHAMRRQGSGILTIRLSRVQIEASDSRSTMLGFTPGPYVKLVVSDTGSGMDRATREKIFEPYFTTKARGEGTGLGLTVVHGIVKSCHGHITVYSEPNRGTTFHIFLPAVEEQAELVRDILQEELPRGLGERILVVDDEGVIVRLQQTLLEELGYRVTAFTNSAQAMHYIREHADEIDLIVTDMTMPGSSGLDVAHVAKGRRAELPVILCTGFSGLVNEEIAQRHGIFRYLIKPVLTRDFADAVKQALARSRQ